MADVGRCAKKDEGGFFFVEELNQVQKKPHKLAIANRKSAAITGVTDVLAFDLHEVLLETTQGMLMIRGDDLHISRLTLEKGEVDVDGRIDSFTYSEAAGYGAKNESFFARLFK